MQIKLLCIIFSVTTIGLAGLNVTGCTKPVPRAGSVQIMQHTCPMHPEVVMEAPGNCPKCGMKLITKP